MITALLLTAIVAQTPSVTRIERITREGGRESGRAGVKAYAFFEAFPVGGAGTTTACSTTPPTGAKGETLTFARASTATCTRTASGGLATTGIADGDLVVMTSNQPRVEYDSAGVLGLLVEAARLNNTLRSQEFENAAWGIETNGGVAAPTITANAATAPDGTLTADRLQFPATTGAGESMIFAAGACGTPCAQTVYVRGVSGSGTLDLCAAFSMCSPCSFVSTSWTRCTAIGTGGTAFIGNGSRYNGAVARSANDVYLWGAQTETATYATSYIPTTSAAVARVVESAAFNGLSISSAAGLSWAASVQHPSANGGSVWASGPALVQDASNRTQLYRQLSNVQTCDYISTSGTRTTGVTVIAAYVAGQSYRQACSYSGPGASSTVAGYRDGVLFATSAAGVTSAWTATSVIPGALGTAATTNPCDCLVGEICVDPNPERCR